MIDIARIENGVVSMLKNNMGVRPGENVIVLTDIPTSEEWLSRSQSELHDVVRRSLLSKAVSEIAKQSFPDCEVGFFAYPSVGRHGTYPGKTVEDIMKTSDAVIAITTYSLTHTDAREEACKVGARVASMPTFFEEMFYPDGPMAADYTAITEETEKIASRLTDADQAEVLSQTGTKIKFSIRNRIGKADTGMLHKRGAWGNLPAGEAYAVPIEETAQGKFIVERGWCEGLVEDMELRVDRGSVTEVRGGGSVGDKVRSLLSLGNDEEPFISRRNIGELGVGTNPKARRPDNFLEAEKIRGTVHLALGDNSHMGGKIHSDLHWDFVIPRASLVLDGKHIMKDGVLNI